MPKPKVECLPFWTIQTGTRPKLDSRKLESLTSSINRVGLLHPILVRDVNGATELIDGYHRMAACERTGYANIQVIWVRADDRLAKQMTEELRTPRRSPRKPRSTARARGGGPPEGNRAS